VTSIWGLAEMSEAPDGVEFLCHVPSRPARGPCRFKQRDVARAFKARTVSIRLIGDLFNALNANTALVRNNNVLSTGFQQLAQNLSPRIFRIGVVIGF